MSIAASAIQSARAYPEPEAKKTAAEKPAAKKLGAKKQAVESPEPARKHCVYEISDEEERPVSRRTRSQSSGPAVTPAADAAASQGRRVLAPAPVSRNTRSQSRSPAPERADRKGKAAAGCQQLPFQ